METIDYSLKLIYPFVAIVGNIGRCAIVNVVTGEKRVVSGTKASAWMNALRLAQTDKEATGQIVATIATQVLRQPFQSLAADSEQWALAILQADQAFFGVPPTSAQTVARSLGEKRWYNTNVIQALNFPSSAVRRVEATFRNSAHKKIALLGDDDHLHSLARAQELDVTVFDIDTELLDLAYHHGATAKKQDFRAGFEPSMEGAFDLILCDPPTSPSWVSLFLDRAVRLCRQEGLVSVATNPLGVADVVQYAKSIGLRIEGRELLPTFYLNHEMKPMQYCSLQLHFRKISSPKFVCALESVHSADIQSNNKPCIYAGDKKNHVWIFDKVEEVPCESEQYRSVFW